MPKWWQFITSINTLRPRQNGRHFADDTFKRIFLNENVRISIKISLKFVPKGPINNIPALVQIMDWRRPGDKPLSEPMMDNLPTHICVTRPQWVNAVTIHWRIFAKFKYIWNSTATWLVTLNCNVATQKQLHAFPKQLYTFPTRQQPRPMSNRFVIDLYSTNTRQIIAAMHTSACKSSHSDTAFIVIIGRELCRSRPVQVTAVRYGPCGIYWYVQWINNIVNKLMINKFANWTETVLVQIINSLISCTWNKIWIS